MAKISKSELEFLKSNISPEQLLELAALKSKMNKRRPGTRAVNESNSPIAEIDGFQKFYEDYLDDYHKNLFNEVFRIFENNDCGSSIQGRVFHLFRVFLDSADKYIADRAN